MAAGRAEQQPGNDKNNDADDGDRGVLAVEIGLSAFADRSGDLLHARIALRPRHNGLNCPK
jgi:hypothetical protein